MAEGSLEEAMDTLDERALVEQVLSKLPLLPAPYREVLTLRYVDGLEIGDIAAMLSVTENVISVRIFRALSKLRALCITE